MRTSWAVVVVSAAVAVVSGCPEPEPEFEPGCITINDATEGFKLLSDALSQASAGDTVRLCSKEFRQPVVIDRDVVLEGEGMDETVIRDRPGGPPGLDREVLPEAGGRPGAGPVGDGP